MKQDQVTDKNLCLAMLNQLKWDATCLTQRILEVGDQQLRQDYINVLDRTFAEQKQLYDIANQYGWHQPMMADQNMINQVKSDLQNLSNDIQQSMVSIHHQAQYQGIQDQYQGIQAPSFNGLDISKGTAATMQNYNSGIYNTQPNFQNMNQQYR